MRAPADTGVDSAYAARTANKAYRTTPLRGLWQHAPYFNPEGSRVIKPGDVLVSRPTARADVYHISVVPAAAHMVKVRYEDAMETGRQVARRLAVDGWFTCDHTHCVRIASPNTERRRSEHLQTIEPEEIW